jgi:hypothetical protein
MDIDFVTCARSQDQLWTKKVCVAVFVVSLVLFALVIEKVTTPSDPVAAKHILTPT